MHPETNDHVVNLRGKHISPRHHRPEPKELPNPRAIQNIKDLQKEEDHTVRVAVSEKTDPQERPERSGTILAWKAPSFEKTHRGGTWYAGLIVIAGILTAFSVYAGNFMFIVVIGLAAIILIVKNMTQPVLIDFAIMKNGVLANERLYEFSGLKSFCIIEPDESRKYLILLSNKKLMPAQKLPLGSQDPEEIRKILLKYIPEETSYEEPLTDILERRLGI